MSKELIDNLHLHGFVVTNRGYIYKHSQNTKSKSVAGQLNKAGAYFYAQNVHPFKQGQNTFKDILGSNAVYIPYVPAASETEHNFTFEDYLNTTKKRNHLSIYLNPFVKCLDNDTDRNPYDLRGVKSGALTDATLFPYINFDNEFITAKIVKYNSVSGKRSKTGYSNNWFHAYKNIKTELGLKDKISKKVDCYFGEHLLRFNNKPVVIVESEKTAIFLSLIYKDIVFLATGGLGKLKGLSYDILANRDVYVFPDNGAAEWFKIAKKRNWWCSTILENKGSEGSDVADYFDTDIGEELAVELNRIQSGQLHFVSDDLNFSLKEKQSKKFCIPNLFQLGLTGYADNSKGHSFKGKNFRIYEEEFISLSANVDFNKYQLQKRSYSNSSEGSRSDSFSKPKSAVRFIPVDAEEFTYRLEKCFRIIKHLNEDEDYISKFILATKHLLEHSNFLFNTKYIEDVLLPMWNNDDNDISEYHKHRNWVFASKNHIEDKEFQKLLNNDKKTYKTNLLLKKLKPLLDELQYIKPMDIELKSSQSNSFVWNIIKEYNEDVLGCKTVNSFKKKVEIQEYLDFVNDNGVLMDSKIKQCNNSCSTYRSSSIYCKENCITFENKHKLPSINTIHENTFINKRTIAEYLNWTLNEEKLLDIKTVVSYLIDNPNDLIFERVNGRVEVAAKHSIEEMRIDVIDSFDIVPKRNDVTTDAAFDYELDLSNSILHVSEEEAIQRGNKFLYSWICFHNQELTENDKLYIDLNPMEHILQTRPLIDINNFAHSKIV